jgi:survival-of-motor-neuron-related-splicing factor 30
MADIKELKDAVWLKKEAIKKEEQGLTEWSGEVATE